MKYLPRLSLASALVLLVAGVALARDLQRLVREVVEHHRGARRGLSFGGEFGLVGLHAGLVRVVHAHELADDGDFEGITQRINGGLNGLTDRLAWLAQARTIIGG